MKQFLKVHTDRSIDLLINLDHVSSVERKNEVSGGGVWIYYIDYSEDSPPMCGDQWC